MPNPTQTSSSGFPFPPHIPGGEEVYNDIMGKIEPELTTKNMPVLAAKYANETQEERTARMGRYKKAFLAYEKAYNAFLSAQEGTLRSYKRSLMSAVEKRSSGDSEALESIEAMISSLT